MSCPMLFSCTILLYPFIPGREALYEYEWYPNAIFITGYSVFETIIITSVLHYSPLPVLRNNVFYTFFVFFGHVTLTFPSLVTCRHGS